jgi:hypothetical protein
MPRAWNGGPPPAIAGVQSDGAASCVAPPIDLAYSMIDDEKSALTPNLPMDFESPSDVKRLERSEAVEQLERLERTDPGGLVVAGIKPVLSR